MLSLHGVVFDILVGAIGSIARSWTASPPDRSSTLWTDDYSNILGAMLRRKFGG
ncbi:MAG: hypothetical protein ACREEK_23095 [Bradyrhizobium sp.]